MIRSGPPKSFDNQARLSRTWRCTSSRWIFTEVYPYKSYKLNHVDRKKKWNHAKSRGKSSRTIREIQKKSFAICTKDCKPKVRELLFETFREWNHAKSREVTRGNGGEMTTSHRSIYGAYNFELHFSIKLFLKQAWKQATHQLGMHVLQFWRIENSQKAGPTTGADLK